jgi:hypothetical protein
MGMKQKMTDKERIEFARNIEYFFESTYASWKRIMLLSLLRGIATGFGVVLGGSILIALLIWLLSGLEQIPFLGDLAENTRQTVEESDSQ